MFPKKAAGRGAPPPKKKKAPVKVAKAPKGPPVDPVEPDADDPTRGAMPPGAGGPPMAQHLPIDPAMLAAIIASLRGGGMQ